MNHVCFTTFHEVSTYVVPMEFTVDILSAPGWPRQSAQRDGDGMGWFSQWFQGEFAGIFSFYSLGNDSDMNNDQELN